MSQTPKKFLEHCLREQVGVCSYKQTKLRFHPRSKPKHRALGFRLNSFVLKLRCFCVCVAVLDTDKYFCQQDNRISRQGTNTKTRKHYRMPIHGLMCIMPGMNGQQGGVLVNPETDKARKLGDFLMLVVYFHFLLAGLYALTGNYMGSLIDMIGATAGYSAVRKANAYAIQCCLGYAVFSAVFFVWGITVLIINYSGITSIGYMEPYMFYLKAAADMGAPIVYALTGVLSYFLWRELKQLFDQNGAVPVDPSAPGPAGMSMGGMGGGMGMGRGMMGGGRGMMGGQGAAPGQQRAPERKVGRRAASDAVSVHSGASSTPSAASNYKPFAGQGSRLS
jgi:hypothetical protein